MIVENLIKETCIIRNITQTCGCKQWTWLRGFRFQNYRHKKWPNSHNGVDDIHSITKSNNDTLVDGNWSRPFNPFITRCTRNWKTYFFILLNHYLIKIIVNTVMKISTKLWSQPNAHQICQKSETITFKTNLKSTLVIIMYMYLFYSTWIYM